MIELVEAGREDEVRRRLVLPRCGERDPVGSELVLVEHGELHDPSGVVSNDHVVNRPRSDPGRTHGERRLAHDRAGAVGVDDRVSAVRLRRVTDQPDVAKLPIASRESNWVDASPATLGPASSSAPRCVVSRQRVEVAAHKTARAVEGGVEDQHGPHELAPMTVATTIDHVMISRRIPSS